MEQHDLNHAKQVVIKGLILLGIITIIEVLIALFGNGHLIHGMHLPKWLMYPMMIGLSLYKAYFIVYEFMHMKYELQGLRFSVLLPTLLLVWAVIAFFNEGGHWRHNRGYIQERNEIGLEKSAPVPVAPAAEGTHEALPAEH